MTDAETTVQALRQRVARFVAERDWEPFHSPKNLVMSLAIEVAELMEHFQWITTEQSQMVVHDATKRVAVSEELADVLSYTLALANAMQIDLSAALEDKMRKNALKYPVQTFRGRYGMDDPNSPAP
jgi:NTP pyrophosphatase (non-canonical NTP hydrolase)